jgi:hypothetical protein
MPGRNTLKYSKQVKNILNLGKNFLINNCAKNPNAYLRGLW